MWTRSTFAIKYFDPLENMMLSWWVFTIPLNIYSGLKIKRSILNIHHVHTVSSTIVIFTKGQPSWWCPLDLIVLLWGTENWGRRCNLYLTPYCLLSTIWKIHLHETWKATDKSKNTLICFFCSLPQSSIIYLKINCRCQLGWGNMSPSSWLLTVELIAWPWLLVVLAKRCLIWMFQSKQQCPLQVLQQQCSAGCNSTRGSGNIWRVCMRHKRNTFEEHA